MFAMPNTREVRRIIREAARDIGVTFERHSWTDKVDVENPKLRQVCLSPLYLGPQPHSKYDELINIIRNRLAQHNLLIIQGLSNNLYVRFYGEIAPRKKKV